MAYSQLECERNLTDNTVLSDTSLRHFFPPPVFGRCDGSLGFFVLVQS